MRTSKSELPFSERVARVWGGLSEIVRDGGDAEVALAAFFQVTPQQLAAWRAAEGRHRCPGVTTRGHGCRNYASTVIDYDPRTWVSREPVFCPTHTGSPQKPHAERPRPVRTVAEGNATGEDDAGVMAR